MFNKNTPGPEPGVHTAIVTPVRGGRIDTDAFSRLLGIQRASNVAGVVVLGTTGESPTVSPGERTELIRIAKSVLGGKKQLTVGCGCSDTEKTVRTVKRAAALGADFALVVTPYYNRPSQRGLLRHFITVADASPVPVIVYNVPSRTGVDVSAQTLSVLAGHPNIVACKEASSDMQSVTEKMRTAQLDFFCGSDTLLYHFLSLGAKGGVCVCSNIAPDLTCGIVDGFLSGEVEAAREAFFRMLPFLSALGCDVNPVPIKALLGCAGLISPEVRQPLCGLTEEKRSALLIAAAEAGVYEK